MPGEDAKTSPEAQAESLHTLVELSGLIHCGQLAQVIGRRVASVVEELWGKFDAVQRERDSLKSELARWRESYPVERVCCPTCGHKWAVPKERLGDPVWDCPQCQAREAGDVRDAPRGE